MKMGFFQKAGFLTPPLSIEADYKHSLEQRPED